MAGWQAAPSLSPYDYAVFVVNTLYPLSTDDCPIRIIRGDHRVSTHLSIVYNAPRREIIRGDQQVHTSAHT